MNVKRKGLHTCCGMVCCAGTVKKILSNVMVSQLLPGAKKEREAASLAFWIHCQLGTKNG